jgi:NAD(P)-dependent dehydrogenase (short-subunit alcohol dehydrogenase family)
MAKEAPARAGLDGRVVVVTDADGDRGRDIARALARLHAAIVVAGGDAEALGALVAELSATGARVAVIVDDVSSEAGGAALVEMVNELFPTTTA